MSAKVLLFGNRTESQRIKSKWKKSQKIIQKKSQKERKSENRLLQIYLLEKSHDFFPMLLFLVTGRFHVQKSREIKSEFSVCVHYTNFSYFFPLTFYPMTFYSLTFLPVALFPCTLLAATL